MTQLNDQVIDLLNANTVPMVNNFTKIVSWLLHGTQSEHKLPPKVLAFLEQCDATNQQAQQTEAKLNTALEMVEKLNGAVNGLVDENKKLLDALKELNDKLVELEKRPTSTTPAPSADENSQQVSQDEANAKPKRATKEADVTAQDDEVEVTAQAVDAGEISLTGVDEISKMIDDVLGELDGGSNTPAMDSL